MIGLRNRKLFEVDLGGNSSSQSQSQQSSPSREDNDEKHGKISQDAIMVKESLKECYSGVGKVDKQGTRSFLNHRIRELQSPFILTQKDTTSISVPMQNNKPTTTIIKPLTKTENHHKVRRATKQKMKIEKVVNQEGVGQMEEIVFEPVLKRWDTSSTVDVIGGSVQGIRTNKDWLERNKKQAHNNNNNQYSVNENTTNSNEYFQNIINHHHHHHHHHQQQEDSSEYLFSPSTDNNKNNTNNSPSLITKHYFFLRFDQLKSSSQQSQQKQQQYQVRQENIGHIQLQTQEWNTKGLLVQCGGGCRHCHHDQRHHDHHRYQQKSGSSQQLSPKMPLFSVLKQQQQYQYQQQQQQQEYQQQQHPMRVEQTLLSLLSSYNRLDANCIVNDRRVSSLECRHGQLNTLRRFLSTPIAAYQTRQFQVRLYKDLFKTQYQLWLNPNTNSPLQQPRLIANATSATFHIDKTTFTINSINSNNQPSFIAHLQSNFNRDLYRLYAYCSYCQDYQQNQSQNRQTQSNQHANYYPCREIQQILNVNFTVDRVAYLPKAIPESSRNYNHINQFQLDNIRKKQLLPLSPSRTKITKITKSLKEKYQSGKFFQQNSIYKLAAVKNVCYNEQFYRKHGVRQSKKTILFQNYKTQQQILFIGKVASKKYKVLVGHGISPLQAFGIVISHVEVS